MPAENKVLIFLFFHLPPLTAFCLRQSKDSPRRRLCSEAYAFCIDLRCVVRKKNKTKKKEGKLHFTGGVFKRGR